MDATQIDKEIVKLQAEAWETMVDLVRERHGMSSQERLGLIRERIELIEWARQFDPARASKDNL